MAVWYERDHIHIWLKRISGHYMLIVYLACNQHKYVLPKIKNFVSFAEIALGIHKYISMSINNFWNILVLLKGIYNFMVLSW